jgi:hypothetical protein
VLNFRVKGVLLRVGSEGWVLIEECCPDNPCAVAEALAVSDNGSSLRPSLMPAGSPKPASPMPLIEGTGDVALLAWCGDCRTFCLSGGSKEIFAGGAADTELGWEVVMGVTMELFLPVLR